MAHRLRRHARSRAALWALVMSLGVTVVATALVSAHIHAAGVGDLYGGNPAVNEHDLTTTDVYRKNNACGAAAATMILDYYLPQSGPAHEAISLDVVAKYVKVTDVGTTGVDLQTGLATASQNLDTGGKAPLQTSWQQTDAQHWLDALHAELNAKLPVIAFIPDGGRLRWSWHYGHYIMVSGYTDDDSIIYYDPWDGARHSLSHDAFASAWGTTWRQNVTWDFLEILPSGVSSPLAVANASPSTGPSSAPSIPNELTYIGSDGNIWDLPLGGAPKQWTSDASGSNGPWYDGLTWSPDGSTLAILRTTQNGSNATSALILLSPDGVTRRTVALRDYPYGAAFTWSPDGSEIAYRIQLPPSVSNYYAASDRDQLVIVNANTGQTINAWPYSQKGLENGPDGTSLTYTLTQPDHRCFFQPDTFSWSPDGRYILVAPHCSLQTGGVTRIDVTTGATTTGFPESAHYLPNGSGIAGWWDDNGTEVLGVANASGQRVTTLDRSSTSYCDSIGSVNLSADGQTIYYEKGGDIWSVAVKGGNPHSVVAGTPCSASSGGSSSAQTWELAPMLSPDGQHLLYFQLRSDDGFSIASSSWYVSAADGSDATQVSNSAATDSQVAIDAAWR